MAQKENPCAQSTKFDDEFGDGRQKRRQQGRQADGEAGSSRGGSEEGMTESRTVYLTDFQDFRALNGFPSFSTPDSCAPDYT